MVTIELKYNALMSQLLNRLRMADALVNEIISSGNRYANRRSFLELMKGDLLYSPVGMQCSDEDFTWLIGVLRRHYTGSAR